MKKLFQIIKEDSLKRKYLEPELLYSEDDKSSFEEKDKPLIAHHFSDLKKAFLKCVASFEKGDYAEAVDNIVLVQSAAFDIEEILTHKEPKV